MSPDFSNFDLNSMGGVITGFANTAMNAFWIILAIAVFGGMIVGISMAIARWKRYDIDCRIYSKRHKGFKTWDQQGAFIKNKDTGEVYGFIIKGVKKTQPPPKLEALFPNEKGKNTIHLLQLAFDEYYVIDPKIEDIYEMLEKAPVIEEKKNE